VSLEVYADFLNVYEDIHNLTIAAKSVELESQAPDISARLPGKMLFSSASFPPAVDDVFSKLHLHNGL